MDNLRMNRSVTLALLLIANSGAAQALDTQTPPQSVDLQIVYDHALTQDPIYQQAEALHMATRETKTQAILDLLPLDANVSQTWNGRNSDNASTPILGNLGLTVNLFSWDKWIALKQANAIVAQG